MKKKIILSLALIQSAFCFSQKSCCMAPTKSTEAFASLSNDKQFVTAHHEPLPFILPNPMGKEISFSTPDGKQGYGYEITSDPKNDKVVFVIHEWWGLNDYIKQESERISKELNVRVIAIDLYDKKVATSRDSAGKYMQAVKTERARSIIKGALAYVGTKAKVGTIGWCFGGGWSLQTALLAGKQAKACVMYYGMPEEDTGKLKALNAPVRFVFAKKDQWINQAVVDKFEANMKSLKKDLSVVTFDADHAFANPSNPHYEKAMSDEAFKGSMDFFKKNLASN
jgi:carboxymethylenebutenolidase